MTSEDQPRRTPPGTPWTWPWRLALAAVFLLALAFALRPMASRDLGFHLRTGQWIVETGTFPRQDVFTTAARGAPYIDLHWSYQVLLFLGHESIGYAGLTVANAGLILLALALVLWRCRDAHPALVTLLSLLGVLALELRMEVRPEVVSWILLGATLLILDGRSRRGGGWLFLLPLIQMLWINMQGLFVIGWLAMGAFCLGDLLERRRLDRPLWGWTMAALAVTVLNPYGVWGVLHPLLLATRLQGSNIFQQAISELGSPWSSALLTGGEYAPVAAFPIFFLLAAVALLAVPPTWRRHRLHDLLLVVACFILASAALRNLPFFILTVIPVLAAALSPGAAAGRLREAAGRRERRRRLAAHPALAVLLLAVTVLIGARVLTGAWYIAARRPQRFGLGLDEMHQPVGAGEFLAAHGLDGRLLNHIDLGGWLMWTAPQPVYIDTRLEVAGEDLFREHQASFAPGGLAALSRQLSADLIVYDPRRAAAWTTQLEAMPWRLILWRPNVVIYAREGYREDVPAVDVAAEVERVVVVPDDRALREIIAAPRPSPYGAWLEGFVSRQDYPEALFSMGYHADLRDELQAAGSLYAGAIRASGGRYREIYLSLEGLFRRHGLDDLADRCLAAAG